MRVGADVCIQLPNMRDPHDTTERLLAELCWVRKLAKSLVRDASTAEDLVQETCLAVLHASPGPVPHFRGFLRTVLRNVWRARVRSESARRDREHAVVPPGDPSSPDDAVQRMESQRVLADAVLALEEPLRSTVILRYMDELSPAEIARRERVPASTVRRRLQSALELLRERLDRTFHGDRRAWAVLLLPVLDLPSTALVEWMGWKGAAVTGSFAMKKALLVACVLALAVATAAVWLHDDSPASISTAARARSEPPHAANAVDVAAPSALSGEDHSKLANDGARVASDGRVRIAGRVASPEGCGADDTVEIFALDRALEYADLVRALDRDDERLLARARADAAGAFEIFVPPAHERAHLGLRGRTLYAPETVEVDLRGAAREVVLAARAGIHVTGRLAAANGADVSGTRVVVAGARADLTPASGILGRGFGLGVRAGADGSFELCALPAGFEYVLFALPDELAAHKVELARLSPCTRKEIALALSTGATIRGRVLDVAGAPVADADVEAALPGRWLGLDDRRVRAARTDASGTFELCAVPAGTVNVRAYKPGSLDSENVAVHTQGGRVATDVELVLEAGRAITGKLVLVGGRPAADAEVAAEFDRAFLANESVFRARRGASGGTRAGGDGRFSIAGLGDGPFVIRASARTSDGTVFRARRDGIVPGGEPLDLVLHPALELALHAVDTTGIPVREFDLHAVRVVEGALGEMGMTREERHVVDAAGRTVLAGLDDGTWVIHARTHGLTSGDGTRVQWPDACARGPLTLVLAPSATIAGRVVQSDGRVAAGARVDVATDEPAAARELHPGPPPPEARADAHGAFRLEGLASGAVRIVARAHAGSALGSAPFDVVLAPGQVVDGIVLALQSGARVTGEVYDARGEPAQGDIVHFQDARGAVRFTAADARGEFEIDELAPGAWQITAVDLQAASVASTTDDQGALVGSVRLARVELAEGETKHVVLGAPPSDPVRVHGTVTSGGAPRGGGWISFFPAHGGGAERMQLATVGRDGAYELSLAAPGTYSISVPQIVGDDDSTIDFTRDVSAGGAQRVDLVLPNGKLAGRVLAPDGSAAAGARVTLMAEGSADDGEYTQGQYTEVSADASGRFAIPALRAGDYVLLAGGPSEDGECFARAVVGEFALVAGQARDDVEVRLQRPGAITVHARTADGEPLADTAIFVRDARGAILEVLSASVTDAHGRGAYECLAPGTYTVLARAGALASRDSAPVRVLAGEDAHVEIVLVPGTALRVELVDREGRPVSGWAYVFDDADREVGGLYPARDVEARYFAGDFSPCAPVFGPLPPGRYRIAASAPGGRAAELDVTLAGEASRTVRIDLGP